MTPVKRPAARRAMRAMNPAIAARTTPVWPAGVAPMPTSVAVTTPNSAAPVPQIAPRIASAVAAGSVAPVNAARTEPTSASVVPAALAARSAALENPRSVARPSSRATPRAAPAAHQTPMPAPRIAHVAPAFASTAHAWLLVARPVKTTTKPPIAARATPASAENAAPAISLVARSV